MLISAEEKTQAAQRACKGTVRLIVKIKTQFALKQGGEQEGITGPADSLAAIQSDLLSEFDLQIIMKFTVHRRTYVEHKQTFCIAQLYKYVAWSEILWALTEC